MTASWSIYRPSGKAPAYGKCEGLEDESSIGKDHDIPL